MKYLIRTIIGSISTQFRLNLKKNVKSDEINYNNQLSTQFRLNFDSNYQYINKILQHSLHLREI